MSAALAGAAGPGRRGKERGVDPPLVLEQIVLHQVLPIRPGESDIIQKDITLGGFEREHDVDLGRIRWSLDLAWQRQYSRTRKPVSPSVMLDTFGGYNSFELGGTTWTALRIFAA
jgi:hypothetical protein